MIKMIVRKKIKFKLTKIKEAQVKIQAQIKKSSLQAKVNQNILTNKTKNSEKSRHEKVAVAIHIVQKVIQVKWINLKNRDVLVEGKNAPKNILKTIEGLSDIAKVLSHLSHLGKISEKFIKRKEARVRKENKVLKIQKSNENMLSEKETLQIVL